MISLILHLFLLLDFDQAGVEKYRKHLFLRVIKVDLCLLSSDLDLSDVVEACSSLWLDCSSKILTLLVKYNQNLPGSSVFRNSSVDGTSVAFVESAVALLLRINQNHIFQLDSKLGVGDQFEKLPSVKLVARSELRLDSRV